LDNTLWPGVAGEEGFDLMGSRDARVSLAIGVFGGIHQALKTLKQQGVLLAICSRQNEADVLTAWAQIGDIVKEQEARHLLSLDDFAITRINWERKSGNIAEILQALGVGTDAALFIDDNPAERAEAQEAFPKLRVLGENLHIIRQTLLTDPCLQSDVQTSEAKSRTQMIKAQLERESAGKQFGDGLSFLRGLNISLKIIRRRNIDRVGMRIMELIQRTNQFNTTLTRYNHRELIDFVNQPEGAVYTLEASDRFASYGLVGVCLLWGDEIANFVMSCRVIPLSAAVPFLSATLLHYERRPLHANIVEGPRNQPCRSLYRDAGFAEVSPGRYQLRDLLNLHPVDCSIYRVDLIDESTLEKPISTPTAPQQNPASQTAYSFTED
jgi:FkbH-like protein